MNHPVDTRRGEQPVLFNTVGKAERHIIMAEELARVRIEGHGGSGDTGFSRRIDCCFNDLAVTAMDPVKISDGRNAGPQFQRCVSDRPGHCLALVGLAMAHGAALYRAKAANINAGTRQNTRRHLCYGRENAASGAAEVGGRLTGRYTWPIPRRSVTWLRRQKRRRSGPMPRRPASTKPRATSLAARGKSHR